MIQDIHVFSIFFLQAHAVDDRLFLDVCLSQRPAPVCLCATTCFQMKAPLMWPSV